MNLKRGDFVSSVLKVTFWRAEGGGLCAWHSLTEAVPDVAGFPCTMRICPTCTHNDSPGFPGQAASHWHGSGANRSNTTKQFALLSVEISVSCTNQERSFVLGG